MATAKETADLAKITKMLTDLTAKLNAVNTSVGDIKTSIINKGVPVPSGTKLSEYDDKIDLIDTATEVDYSDILTALGDLGTTLDAINGEVITAPASGGSGS